MTFQNLLLKNLNAEQTFKNKQNQDNKELKETIGNLQSENCELLEWINEEAEVGNIKTMRDEDTMLNLKEIKAVLQEQVKQLRKKIVKLATKTQKFKNEVDRLK